jgi:hypothetical protein
MEIGIRAREGRQAYGTPGDSSHVSRSCYRMFTVAPSPSLGQKIVCPLPSRFRVLGLPGRS